jgi:SAM-dependent methyltransferase
MEHLLVSLRCPVCSTISSVERRTSEVDLWRCPSCDHCFSNVDSISSLEKYSSEYYEVTHRNWFENPNIALFETICQFIIQNKPNASLIDLGCGNGNFLKYLHKKNRSLSLTGIDIAQNRAAKGITFLQGDALVADFDSQYDVVVSLAVIEHVTDIQKFVNRLYSLCAPQGFVIIMTLNERSILYGVARLLYNLGYKTPCERLYSKHHLNHFNVSSLKKLVETNRLSVIKIFLHNVPLSAVDLTASSHTAATILRAGVWSTFMIGSLIGRTYLQTIICKKSTEEDL